MTRGQVGSLRLTCTTLAFATSRRFIPAHSNCVQNSPNCIAKPRRDSLSVFASHPRQTHKLEYVQNNERSHESHHEHSGTERPYPVNVGRETRSCPADQRRQPGAL